MCRSTSSQHVENAEQQPRRSGDKMKTEEQKAGKSWLEYIAVAYQELVTSQLLYWNQEYTWIWDL